MLLINELVSDFISYKVNRCGSTDSTRLTYGSILGELVRCIPVYDVNELSLDVIDTYVDGISQLGLKPKTFKNKVVVIRSFIRYLYSKNLTDIRPESIVLMGMKIVPTRRPPLPISDSRPIPRVA